MSTNDGPAITYLPLDNGAWWSRTLKPMARIVVHVTGNPKLPSADGERDYANRENSGGPSAHDYIDRDGGIVEALNPLTQCAWSNGDVKSPNMANAGVARIVNSGLNPNQVTYREVELVGYPGTADPTDAQLESVAQLIAYDAAHCPSLAALPFDRTSILTHADINSVDRANCAFRPAIREARMTWLINRVKQLVAPAEPAPEEVPMRTFAPLGILADVTVKSDLPHLAVPLDGVANKVNPWPKLNPGSVFAKALKVRLDVAIEGGLPGEDRQTAWLVGKVGTDKRVSIVLDKDVKAVPVTDAKLAAAKAKAQEIVAL